MHVGSRASWSALNPQPPPEALPDNQSPTQPLSQTSGAFGVQKPLGGVVMSACRLHSSIPPSVSIQEGSERLALSTIPMTGMNVGVASQPLHELGSAHSTRT